RHHLHNPRHLPGNDRGHPCPHLLRRLSLTPTAQKQIPLTPTASRPLGAPCPDPRQRRRRLTRQFHLDQIHLRQHPQPLRPQRCRSRMDHIRQQRRPPLCPISLHRLRIARHSPFRRWRHHL